MIKRALNFAPLDFDHSGFNTSKFKFFPTSLFSQVNSFSLTYNTNKFIVENGNLFTNISIDDATSCEEKNKIVKKELI